MKIKKAYVELIALLEANSNKKVSTILAEVKALCESKNASASDSGKTFLKNDEGEVIAIYCYYHKVWEPLIDVEYGTKKHSTTGLNTMCKAGVSSWTKQQRIAKQSKESLLGKLAIGELEVSDLESEMAKIEATRVSIEMGDNSVIFHSSEECLEYCLKEA